MLIHQTRSPAALKPCRIPSSGRCSTTAWVAGPCTRFLVWRWAISLIDGACPFPSAPPCIHFWASVYADRKSVVQGSRGDVGGGGIVESTQGTSRDGRRARRTSDQPVNTRRQSVSAR